MSQAQRLLKNGNQCMAGSSLNSFVALVELDFRKFKIPVAVLVPNEGVDCVGSVIETVVFKGLTDFLNSTFELGPNPLIWSGVFHRSIRIKTAVFAFNVHQNEACGVPELVAEIAVTVGAFDVEVHITAEGCIGSHREAQGVRTDFIDAFRVMLAQFPFNDRSFFGLTKAGRILLD